MPRTNLFLNPVLVRELDDYRKLTGHFIQGDITEGEFRPLRTLFGIHRQRQEDDYMLRVKVPGGRLGLEALKVLGRLVEGSVSRAKLHVTTRQDIQFYFLKLWEIPALLEQLEAAGLTSREAGGSSIRNISCPSRSGLVEGEPFDPYPYAQALFAHFLRRDEFRSLPRKFKVSFCSGEEGDPLPYYSDLGLHCRIHHDGPHLRRGFQVTVGGGLGASPQRAWIYRDFLPAEELLPHVEAILTHFDEKGDRMLRHGARLKYLVRQEGIEAFLAATERIRRERLPGSMPLDLRLEPEMPQLPEAQAPVADLEGYGEWLEGNCAHQKQPGYFQVLIRLPLGELLAAQALGLASVMAWAGLKEIRLTLDQNFLLPWVPAKRLPELYLALKRLDLDGLWPSSAADPVCCPGKETCGQAWVSSRALARAIHARLAQRSDLIGTMSGISVAVSACPNGCSRHRLADIGFEGGTRKHGGQAIPLFSLCLGGGSTGLSPRAEPRMGFPSRRAPQVVERLVEAYATNRRGGETFGNWSSRLTKMDCESLLGDLSQVHATEGELFFDNEAEVPFVPERSGHTEC